MVTWSTERFLVREFWTPTRVGVAAAAAIASGLVMGIPTGIIVTPFYQRMTPVLWWNFPVWALSAIMAGLIAGTYVRSVAPGDSGGRNGLIGTVLSAFAVGCPICNKIVVALIGVSGALSIWAPFQPILAVASLSLLGWALWRRLQNEKLCRLTATGADADS